MRLILRFIAKCQVEYEYWKWLLVTSCRIVSGRWYIFRDAPLWFVKMIANTPPDEYDSKDKRLMAYWCAARDELHTREKRAENVS